MVCFLKKLFNIKKQLRVFVEAFQVGHKNRHLILFLTKQELFEPYTGQIFGRFWTLGHPLFLMFLYTFIFNMVFNTRIGGTYELPLDYTIYILSGLVPWLSTQQVLAKSCSVILGNANLVKQVVFPLEVLPIKTALSAIVFLFIGIAFIFIYSLLYMKTAYITYVLLPLAIVTQLVAMCGVAYVLSSLSVFVKDVKDIIQLFSTISLFMMPVIYLPGSVPASFKYVIYLNPFTYMTWVYQDIFYFGRIEHQAAWGIYLISSFLWLVVGYYLFSKLRNYFGNLL